MINSFKKLVFIVDEFGGGIVPWANDLATSHY